MEYALLSPLNDHVFKRLLGEQDSIDILADFLQSLLDLPAEDYVGMEIVDTRLRRKYPLDKEGILDIKIITPKGEAIDIEVQVNAQPWLMERLLFYTAGMIVEQIGQGDNYDRINRVITIVIADHNITERGGKRYHHRYILYDPDARREYPRLIEIHTLELPKLPKGGEGSKLLKWLRFFAARQTGEFEMITKDEPKLIKAWGKLKELSADERERLIANAMEKERRDREIMQIAGRKEGLKEGLKKGIEQTAVNALRQGLPLETIAIITGLSVEEIERLGKS